MGKLFFNILVQYNQDQFYSVFFYWIGSAKYTPSRTCILQNSVMDPITLNLDPDPGFWPNLDPVPDPYPGLCYQF